MIALALIALLLPGPQSAPSITHAISKFCYRGTCDYLIVEDGRVTDYMPVPGTTLRRTVPLGKYAAQAQHLVPASEAPVREIRDQDGWTMVISAAVGLEPTATLRVRIFAPDGRKALETPGGHGEVLELARLGRLFSGNDEVAAVCSSAPHRYTEECSVWYLPPRGPARALILNFDGSIRIQRAASADGVFTKERIVAGGPSLVLIKRNFWAWDPAAKTLTEQPSVR